MLKKLLIITACMSLLAACASETKKVRLEGKRISIKPEETNLVADTELAGVDVILPKQINFADWTQAGGFADHAPLHPKIDDSLNKGWKRSIGSRLKDYQSFTASPIVFNKVIYTLNTDNQIVALDTKSGKKLWTKKLKSELDKDELVTPGALAIDGATLIATLSSGDIYAINLVTKKIKWHQNLNEPVRATPTIKDGQVFISSLNNKLSVFNIADGNLIWTHTGLPERLTILGDSSPAVAQGIVVVTYSSGEVYALDLVTGGEIWSDTLVKTSTFELTEQILDVVASPVIVGNLLHVVNYNGRLTTFNLKTGQKYWTRNVSSVATPWIAGNTIFIVAENGLLASVYRKTGQVKWVTNLNETMHAKLKTEDKANAIFTAPFLAGNRLIIASNKGYIATFDALEGKLIGAHNIKESISVNPIVADGTVYFLTDRSNIISYK